MQKRTTILSALLCPLALAAVQAPAAAPEFEGARPMTPLDVLNLSSLADADPSPDSRQVVYVLESSDWAENKRSKDIWLAGYERQKPVRLTFDSSDDTLPRWLPDGRRIYVLANMGVHNRLFSIDARSGRATKIIDGRGTVGAWRYSGDSDTHVLKIVSARSPGDLWGFPAGRASRMRQLTHTFDGRQATFRLPEQDVVQWRGADGVTVEGLLNYPLDYAPGKRYPLVVHTHGGPRQSVQHGVWRWRNYMPVLAANGVPSALYLAPREGHGFRELRHRLFKINAELEWFERHANGREYERQPAPESKSSSDADD